MARTRNLDAKVTVYVARWSLRGLPLCRAFFRILGCRDRGELVTFEAEGPDAARAIEIIAQAASDPPEFGRASLIYCGIDPEQREEEA